MPTIETPLAQKPSSMRRIFGATLARDRCWLSGDGMRTIPMLAAVGFLLACGDRGMAGGSKSIYTLTKDDFANHRDAIVSSSASACTGQSCVQVEKGDLLLITATGSLQTSLGATGPEGTATWGGNP